jgi:outer membrane protein TolC
VIPLRSPHPLRQLALAGLLLLAAPARAAAPLTLDDALALAARGNADLAAARAELEVSRAGVGVARAAVLPRLDLQSSLGREAWGAARVDVGGLTLPQKAGDAEAYALGLQARQPLVDLGRFRTLAQARHGATAAERQLDEATLGVAFQVTQRFYELLKQERVQAVLEETAQRSGELADRADALFAAGRAPRAETLTARVNLQNDRIAVEAQRVRVVQARTALAKAIGWSGPERLVVAPPPELDAAPGPAEEPPPLEALVAQAHARRPALAADAARLRAARSGVSAARAGYLPTLELQGTYSRSGSRLSGADGVYGDPARGYTATGQVVLSWTLFDGLGTHAAVRRAGGELARAEAAAQRTGETVAEEVENARAAVVALGRQVELAQGSLAVARDALRLARERFEAGLASELELRDANLKLSQAELTRVQARIDHAVARADLLRAAGGTP